MSGALISDCGNYRYTLSRTASSEGERKRLLFVMLNPSIADASLDDPTIRKCVGFAKRWGYTDINVVNLFAWRSTMPEALLIHRDKIDIVGADNDRFIRALAADANCVVFAWGSWGDRFAERTETVRRLVSDHTAKEPLCLGTTKSGQPRHPLYVSYDQPLVPWSAPR